MAWTGDEEARPVVDASKPNPARVGDYLLSGKDNFAADRDLAARLEAASGGGTGVRELTRINRAFVLGVTTRAVSLGIGQIADLGAGLPCHPSVHEMAQSTGYPVRVAYVDKDPMVVSHLTALCAGIGVRTVRADVSDPGSVLEDPALLEVIDLSEPVLLLLGCTLSAMEPGVARSAVAGYAAALAPESRIAISCASYSDPETGSRMAAIYSPAGDWFNHSSGDIGSFFAAGGLKGPEGGEVVVADLRRWPVVPEKRRDAAVLGGVGVKP